MGDRPIMWVGADAPLIVTARGSFGTLGRRKSKRAMTEIRSEHPDDVAAIRHVNERAFGSPGEAELVDKLRAANKAVVSLVAQRGDQVVGHILFSPITVTNAPGSFRGVGLAPVVSGHKSNNCSWLPSSI